MANSKDAYNVLEEAMQRKGDKPQVVEIWHDSFGHGTFTVFSRLQDDTRLEFVLHDYDYEQFLKKLHRNKIGVVISYF